MKAETAIATTVLQKSGALNGKEQRMNKEIIYREDAIDAIESTDWYHINRNGEMVYGANDELHQAWQKADEIHKAIESIPSAERKGEWIPCSERLPNENEWVLSSCNNGFAILILKLKGKVWHKTESIEYLPKFVNAWMPLPKPYGERGE